MNLSELRRNPWPYAIVGYFIVFITFIAVFVSWAVHQSTDLVRDDYYEHEIRYQQQIDRLNRTARLASDVTVAYEPAQNSILLTLPASHTRGAAGKIQLYRPSNAKLDRSLPLAVTASGTQRVDAKPLMPGLWKVRVQWKVGDEEFFFDSPVVVAPHS